jgi:signal transduction histidine kinase
LALAQKNNSPLYEVKALGFFGQTYDYSRQFSLALEYLKRALTLALKNHFDEQVYGFYNSMLNICFFLGNYPYALELSMQGLSWTQSIGNKLQEGVFHNLIGYISNKQGNLAEANKQYSIYLSIAESLKDSSRIAHAYREWSDVFLDNHQPDTALSYLMKAYTIYKDLEFTGASSSKNSGDYSRVGNLVTVYKISQVYKEKKDYESALQYALKSVLYPEAPNRYELAAYYINLGDVYQKLNKPKPALENLQQGLSIAKEIQHNEDIRDAYYNLSEFYKKEKKFDSTYYYYNNYVSLKDSIVNERTRQNIAFMQSQFDAEKKDEQIKAQQAKLKQQSLVRNIIICSSGLLLIIFALFYNRYRLGQKNRFQQQLNKQQNELMNTVIVTQDKERKRIAEDLHDTLGSILSAAKLKLSAVAENGNGQHQYDDTMNLLDEAVNEMRNISHNLLPASLLRLGLVAGLQNLLDKISSRSALQISFVAHGFKKRIDENIEVSIYRIILEAVNNIVKHAQAKNVIVQLTQYDTYINVLIEDDGIGFDKNLVLKEHGIGLNNIFSRVDYMKGTVDIDTKPRAGTVINIDIPYLEV